MRFSQIIKKNTTETAGVGIVTKQNATQDVPIGGEYMNVKKLGLGKGKPKELHKKARKNSDPNTLFNLGLGENKYKELTKSELQNIAKQVGIPFSALQKRIDAESSGKHFDKRGKVKVGDKKFKPKDRAYGLGQMRSIALKDLNQNIGTKYSVKDMKNPKTNAIATAQYLKLLGDKYYPKFDKRQVGAFTKDEYIQKAYQYGPNAMYKTKGAGGAYPKDRPLLRPGTQRYKKIQKPIKRPGFLDTAKKIFNPKTAIQNFDKKTNLSKDFKSMVKQTKKELPTVDKDSFVYKNIYKPARDFVSKGIQNLKNDPEFKKIGQKQKELYGPKSKGDIKTNTKEARGTCWHGYQQKGFKKKGNRMVPNCVKEDAMLKIIEGPNDPAIFKAIFTAGGPGSGKTFIVKNTALEGMGYKIVNSDKQFEYYLAQAGLSKGPEQIYSPQGQEIRRKAVDITDKFKTNYIEGRLGLVIDGTGKNLDRIQKQKQDLEKLGYECAMIFVNTNLKSALKRNKFRDRILPDNVVKEMWNQVQENIGNFQRLFKENLFIIDNSEGHNVQKDIDIAFKRLGQWTSKPPKTKQAKAWLDSQVVKELKIVKPDPKNTLGKKRSEMPQIKDEDYGDFIKYMQDNGVTFIAKTLPAKDLKPMQKDFSDAGVLKQIKKQMNPDAFKKPVILSSDGYIVDGHHRWLVASNTGKDLDVHQVNLPAEELYTLARKFDKVYYKDVYERGGISVPFSSGLRVGIFPYRPLKIKKSTPGKLRYEGKNDMKISDLINEGKRIPRKKGQPAGSKKHSDLYTDENPKGTIHGLKFATVKDAEASVRKIKSSGKAHAHKIQAAIAMEQRAKAAGKKSAAAVYRRYINKMKKKTKKMKEATEQLSLVLEQLQGQGYEKGNRIVNGRT